MCKFKKPVLLLVIISLIIVLMPLDYARAQLPGSVLNTIGKSAMESITSMASGSVVLIKGAISYGLYILGPGIDSLLSVQIGDSDVVRNAWNLVRQFANMLFIVALIIMAFGTIFNIRGYEFKSLIVNFIIAALLINFSLAIGVFIIDLTNSLSDVFRQAIGSIGVRIGQIANLGSNFGEPRTGNIVPTVELTAWQAAIGGIADIVLMSIVLFSLVVFFILVAVRIPFLWALLILSPLAWITYILPTTRNINRMWWKYFLGWNLFLPLYLFFIYFGVYLMSHRTEILGGNNTVTVLNISFEDVFYYFLIGVFMIGGAKAAMSGSMAAGAGGVASAIWARGSLVNRKSWLPFRGAYDKASTYYGKEGVRLIPGSDRRFFGSRQKDEMEAKIAGLVGVPGASEKNFLNKVEAEAQRMREKRTYDRPDELRKIITSGSREQKIAAAKLLKEFHVDELNADQIKEVYEAYNSAGLTAQASKFLAGINAEKLGAEDFKKLKEYKDKISPAYRRQFLSKLTDAEIKNSRFTNATAYQNLLKNYGNSQDDVMSALKKTDKDFIDSLSKDDLQGLFDMFGNMPEAQKFIADKMLKKGHLKSDKLGGLFAEGGLYASEFERERALKNAEETRLTSILRIRDELKLLKDDQGNPISFEEAMANKVGRLNAGGILKIKADEMDDSFMTALESSVRKNPKKIGQILQHENYTDEYAEKLGPMLTRLMEEAKKQRKEKMDEEEKKKKKKGGSDDNTPPSGGSGGEETPPPEGGGSGGGTPQPRPPRPSGGGNIPGFSSGYGTSTWRPNPPRQPEPEPKNTAPNPPQHLGGPTVFGRPTEEDESSWENEGGAIPQDKPSLDTSEIKKQADKLSKNKNQPSSPGETELGIMLGSDSELKNSLRILDSEIERKIQELGKAGGSGVINRQETEDRIKNEIKAIQKQKIDRIGTEIGIQESEYQKGGKAQGVMDRPAEQKRIMNLINALKQERIKIQNQKIEDIKPSINKN